MGTIESEGEWEWEWGLTMGTIEREGEWEWEWEWGHTMIRVGVESHNEQRGRVGVGVELHHDQ